METADISRRLTAQVSFYTTQGFSVPLHVLVFKVSGVLQFVCVCKLPVRCFMLCDVLFDIVRSGSLEDESHSKSNSTSSTSLHRHMDSHHTQVNAHRQLHTTKHIIVRCFVLMETGAFSFCPYLTC